ncbi:MAG: c-type cytochrome [Anaerolineae bacterium]|nr:c-type cytochrome [Anaerolineae bacterium]
MRKTAKLTVVFLLLFLSLSGFAACKRAGNGGTPVEEKATPTLITDATVPATHVWKQPTTIIESTIAATVEATATPASDEAKLIERGKMIYAKIECNTCHGDNGEGLSDKGAKLAGTALTEAEFRDILRTGAKGELGNEHIFGTSVVSESGITAVYVFLQSLGP